MSFPAESHNVNVKTKQNKTNSTLQVVLDTQPPSSQFPYLDLRCFLSFFLLFKINYLCPKKICHVEHSW